MPRLPVIAILALLFTSSLCHAREIALTFDDAPTPDSALMTGAERSQRLIAALLKATVPDALFFVKADYINQDTQKRLTQYSAAGFHLANHSYSHQSAGALGPLDYLADAYKAHLLLKTQDNFLPYHRFPYLNCGKDNSSILAIRQSLSELGYKDGYVTVGTFDWYISSLLTKAAEENQTIDYNNAKKFYVETLYEAIEFYDALAQKALGRSPKHVMLLHENDAAALFIGDLIAHLRSKGWKVISPQDAYQDPIAHNFPNIIYHKQNKLAAIANSKGVPESTLFHVSENIEYIDTAFTAADIVGK
ncbi:MAG: polysaccharide deacetylase family protein [Cellvibrio sp.]|uniref:polysaccharide deacetylase family protein n=1 Tax=Cellvibrio sp. TaxID=1965322 RepID=UPI002728C206|nr:polysaccharide deacetylase family protein [Cellvibrio sp.]